MSVARRELRLDSLAAAVADAESLLERGYDRAGNWSLAQCCDHLTNWLTYPLDGFPKSPLPVRLALRVMRAVSGRRLLEKFLAEGMPAGRPTIPASVPAPGGDDAAAVERFKQAAARYFAHDEPKLPSPLFGPLTHDEGLAVQTRHAAHHLSFLIPKSPDAHTP